MRQGRLSAIGLVALLLWVASAPPATAAVISASAPQAAQPLSAFAGLPVYEASLDLATPTGKFSEFEARLPALQEMGVGIVWLLPIFPRGGNPPDKPRSLSPYCVRDYYDTNPRHGTRAEFKHLVDAIHARGMFLIMDWVPNHTAWGNDLIKTHPEFYKKDKDGRIVDPGPWKDVAQLDYANRALWDYMYEARKYWITQFGVDGFREDAVDKIPLEHWQWLRPKLNALKPVFMLAEADTPKLHPVFDMTYDWTSQVYFYQIARGAWPASSLDRLLKEESQQFPAGALRMRHLTNHDMAQSQYSWGNRAHLDKKEYPFLEKTTLAEKYKGGERAFALLCAALPGSKPMIWNGQELGILSRTPKLDWLAPPRVPGQPEFYRALFQACRRTPALARGEFAKLAVDRPDSVYAFGRRAGASRAVVVVNLSAEPQRVALQLGEAAGAFTEVFTGEARTLAAREPLDLGPWAYRLYLK